MANLNNPVDPYGHLRELTLRGMVLGALITLVFTASNVYLGLKVGLTFASSIPAAVISMAVLRFFPGHNILENNMVQSQASAAGTISTVIFVLPGLLMIGYWQGFPFWLTTVVCCAGGFLGVIFTIPLRRVMVVNSDLPYPEGVAAAEILKAGDGGASASALARRQLEPKDAKEPDEAMGGQAAAAAPGAEDPAESGIKDIAYGGIVAGVTTFLTQGLKVVADSAGYFFRAGASVFQIPMGFSLAMLGAGYLVGIVSGLAILFGLALAWFVLVPIYTASVPFDAGADIAAVALTAWKEKARYVGVGMMTVAAIWTLISLYKPMIEGMRQSIRHYKSGKLMEEGDDRADMDMSPKSMLAVVVLSLLMLLGSFWSFVGGNVTPGLAAVLVLLCVGMVFVIGFLVAAACGYMAGLVGSSSSPISGIGIISIIVMSVLLFAIGKSTGLMATPEGSMFVTALALFTTAAVLAVACISNDNLQDLKTGYLVSATPQKQQIALLIGIVAGAIVLAPIMQVLYQAYGFTGALPRPGMDEASALSAPQATLMSQIAKGIFTGQLEWSYMVTGAVLGAAVIVVDFALRKKGRGALPPLAVGMGIYLPPSINSAIVVGALLSWFLRRCVNGAAKAKGVDARRAYEKANRNGTLFSAGLIVGESLIGVVLAPAIAASVTSGGSQEPLAIHLQNWGAAGQLLGLALFVGAMLLLSRRVLKARP